jgi:adenylate cyclase
MPVREHEQPDRQGSESSTSSWKSQDTVRNNDTLRPDQNKSSSNGPNAEQFPGSLNTDK